MTKEFEPLLAKEANFDLIDWTAGDSWLISPKLDGIRALGLDGTLVSRKRKLIPNESVRQRFGNLAHYDGELILGSPTDKDVYNKTYSAVMKAKGEPDVTFYVFDHIENPDDDYEDRRAKLVEGPGVVVLPQFKVANLEDVRRLEAIFLSQGYEGAMLRKARGPNSRYKWGRSTQREGTLLKIKSFTDDEAVIIGMNEEMHNGNEATTDAFGHTKRSSHAENKVGKGRMGALVCQTKAGIEFNIGTGFTAAQRQEMWDQREQLVGQLVKFKHFEIGAQQAPRFPVFLGLRAEIDT